MPSQDRILPPAPFLSDLDEPETQEALGPDRLTIPYKGRRSESAAPIRARAAAKRTSPPTLRDGRTVKRTQTSPSTKSLVSKTKIVRYAVIGLGYIAQIAMLPAFANAKVNSRLVALVSDDEEKLEKLGRKYGVQLRCKYEDLDKLLSSGAVDAVYIALPNSMHKEYAIRAANAGVHVLCEKPMAVHAAECEAMMEVAKKNNVKLMIAYRLHFEPGTVEVAQIVRSGKIGDLRYFASQFSQQVAYGNIRLKRDLGGGPLYDIGIYCINAARMLFNAEPTEVLATATTHDDPRFKEVPETISATLKFPKNGIASFTCSFGAADRSVYEVVGTKGSLTVEPAYEFSEGLAYELRVGDKKQSKQHKKFDQFAPQLIYFSECVLTGKDPEPSGNEGQIDVRIIEAMSESILNGKWVALNLPQRKRRPAKDQAMAKPGIEPPKLIRAESPSG